MKKRLLGAVLSIGLLFGSVAPAAAATRHHYRTHRQYVKHRRHMKTLKRVGIGAAGGAAVGAIVGRGPGGAAIGAAAGAGAGALYDRHKKHQGHY